MGIESDQLVFDYLSRVGDLAQQHQLPSGTRMQLVTSLRNEIDRQRARHGTDNPAAVRRILGRLGTPDEVVAAASPDGAGQPGVARRTAPARAPQAAPRVPRPRKASESAASPPHLAGMDELGDASGGEPDWWRIGPDPADSGIGGFVGGVEIPEILKPPPGDGAEAEEGEGDGNGDASAGGEAGAAPTAPGRRRWLPRLLRRTAAETGAPDKATAVRRSLGSPFLLVAAALLAVGTILGSWLALGLGWLLAYASNTLSRAQAKWAVLGLPGAVAGGAAVWLWGRVNGHWGEPIPPGGDAMADVLAGTWPWVLRGAAVATALYLVHRARRT
ncbi:hypothetical protein [Streptomyces sp. NPDC127084]|uniref:hypothetical protein n=1 Tax=Streptomyces sp. NPDC127084 TaxID=3347133 RepID=UPI0036517924